MDRCVNCRGAGRMESLSAPVLSCETDSDPPYVRLLGCDLGVGWGLESRTSGLIAVLRFDRCLVVLSDDPNWAKQVLFWCGSP